MIIITLNGKKLQADEIELSEKILSMIASIIDNR